MDPSRKRTQAPSPLPTPGTDGGNSSCSGLAAKNCPQPGGSSPPRDLPPSAGRCRDAPRWKVWGTQRLSIGPVGPFKPAARLPAQAEKAGKDGPGMSSGRRVWGPGPRASSRANRGKAGRAGRALRAAMALATEFPPSPAGPLCRAKRSCERRRLVSGSPRPWLVRFPLGPGEPGVP